jgi:hypothetical protein
MDGVAVPVQLSKLVAVANACSNRWRNHWQLRENCMNFIRHDLKHVLQKISGSAPVHLFKEWFAAKLLMRSMLTNIYIFPSAVWNSATSMWNKPMG